MTGSGFPMKFADADGTVLDIYQATTHLVNENGVDHVGSVHFLIDKATGPEGFFGAFGTHYDYSDDFFKTITAIAKSRGIAMISAEQLLQWLDARNASRFDNIVWKENTLSFQAHVGTGTNTVTAMLPLWSSGHRLMTVACDGIPASFQEQTLKGLEYATFPVKSGPCEAFYEEERSSRVSPSLME